MASSSSSSPMTDGAGEAIAPSGSATTDASEHGVDPVLLAQLLEMGVAKNLAVRSLLYSGNSSVEASFAWMSQLSAEEQEALMNKSLCEEQKEWVDISTEGDDQSAATGDMAMVLVVNSSLGMRPGKVAAQVGHAVLGLHKQLVRRPLRQRRHLVTWEQAGERMVVVKGGNAEQLQELRRLADSLHLPSYQVNDAGRTQVAEGSMTVLAIFGQQSEVDQVTGKLKLY